MDSTQTTIFVEALENIAKAVEANTEALVQLNNQAYDQTDAVLKLAGTLAKFIDESGNVNIKINGGTVEVSQPRNESFDVSGLVYTSPQL